MFRRLAAPIASGTLSAALWTGWAAACAHGCWWAAGLTDVAIVVVGAFGVKWFLRKKDRDKFVAFAVSSGVASAAVVWAVGG